MRPGPPGVGAACIEQSDSEDGTRLLLLERIVLDGAIEWVCLQVVAAVLDEPLHRLRHLHALHAAVDTQLLHFGEHLRALPLEALRWHGGRRRRDDDVERPTRMRRGLGGIRREHQTDRTDGRCKRDSVILPRQRKHG